jgi:hypothetical protein
MADGAIGLTTSVPNTSKVGGLADRAGRHYALKGLDDPIVTAAAEQASRN